jgi:hypothetical protein
MALHRCASISSGLLLTVPYNIRLQQVIQSQLFLLLILKFFTVRSIGTKYLCHTGQIGSDHLLRLFITATMLPKINTNWMPHYQYEAPQVMLSYQKPRQTTRLLMAHTHQHMATSRGNPTSKVPLHAEILFNFLVYTYPPTSYVHRPSSRLLARA